MELSGSDVLMAVAIVVLLLIAMFLAVAETGLTRMNRIKAMALEEEGRKSAARLVELVSHPEAFLNPVLLVVLVAQLVQATLTGLLADRLFGPLGVAIATFFNVVVVFVFAEAAPKTWAVQHPERAALASAGPVSALVRFWPVRVLSRGLIGLTNVILPGKGLKKGPFVSEEEILALADVAAEEDVIEREERTLIRSIIEFGDTVVREVMVPRPDMVTVVASATAHDAIGVVLERGYSRLPVVGEHIDDIVGVVYAKDLMRADREGRGGAPVRELVREPRFVPETKAVSALLREMQAEKYHLALVVDEYGGTAGLVTLEDLIEELVGEIVDEYDVEDLVADDLGDGTWLVTGRLGIGDLNELLGAALPDTDVDTVAGLVFTLLGRMPGEGDAVVVDGYRLVVDKVQGRRIARVRVCPAAGSRVGDAGDGDGVEGPGGPPPGEAAGEPSPAAATSDVTGEPEGP